MEVESVPGEGSTFTFRLPFKVNDVLIQKETNHQKNRWQVCISFWQKIMRSTWRLQSFI